MTTPESPGKAYTIAALLGAALWIVGSKVSDRREAWDSETYWIFFYPAAIGACAALAYLFPDRPWRWCIALFAAQFVTMVMLSGEIGNLAPLGIIAFGIISLPAIGAAQLVAGIRRRKP